MAVELPLVRHFIACKEIVYDPDGRSVSLKDLVIAIVPLPGEQYPLIREELALYALLTNGRGKHAFALELTRFEDGVEVSVARTPAREVDLGQDPAIVHGMPMPLRNMVFEQPGQYTFHLLCDDTVLAEEKIQLREGP
jgi:hypothetical protein